MSDSASLQPHIRALESGDATAHQHALQALREIDNKEMASAPPGAVHSLVKSLRQHLQSDTTPAPIRRQVVAVLDKLGPRAAPAVPELIALLRAGHTEGTREATAAALGRIGPEARDAVDTLVELLSGDRSPLVARAVRALGDIGHPSGHVGGALLGLWRSPSQPLGLHVEVATALCKLRIDAPGLARFLTDVLVANSEAAVRKSAAEALAWRDSDETDVVPALLRAAVIDKHEDVRGAAEAGLTKLGLSREQAISVTAGQLGASVHAEAALRHSGGQAIPALAEILGAGEHAAREKAARILGFLGEVAASAAPALRKVLGARDLGLRLAAAKALWNISRDAAAVTPVLVGLLRADWAVGEDATEARRRSLQTVMEALRAIGPPAAAAVGVLTEMSNDRNRLISESARSALKEIVPPAPSKGAS